MNTSSAYLVSTLSLTAIFAACSSSDEGAGNTMAANTGGTGTGTTGTTNNGGSGTVDTTSGGTATSSGGTATTSGGAATTSGGAATSTGGAATSTGGAATAMGGAAAGMAGSGATAGPVSAPTDTTAAGISAFIASGEYQMAPWVSDVDAPREAEGASPHGRVRVFFNDGIQASWAAGNGMLPEGEIQPTSGHTTSSMVVKEMYDDADALVAIAAMLKLDGEYNQWAYYCEGPASRCGEEGEVEHTAADPVYGVGVDFNVACYFCHSGLIFTDVPTMD